MHRSQAVEQPETGVESSEGDHIRQAGGGPVTRRSKLATRFCFCIQKEALARRRP
jgi:hypothetical protein